MEEFKKPGKKKRDRHNQEKRIYNMTPGIPDNDIDRYGDANTCAFDDPVKKQVIVKAREVEPENDKSGKCGKDYGFG